MKSIRPTQQCVHPYSLPATGEAEEGVWLEASID